MAFRILSTLLLASGLLMAQRGGGGGGGGMSRNNGNMGPEGMSRTEPLDQLAEMLKLNKDQKKEVKGIMDETQKELAPMRESMVKSREQIAAAIEAGKSQDEVDKAVKDFAALEAQVSGVEAKTFAKIFTSLDAEQKSNAQGLVSSIGFMHEVFKRKNWNVNPSQ